MSVGFLLPNPDDAVIWRGPKKNGRRPVEFSVDGSRGEPYSPTPDHLPLTRSDKAVSKGR